MRKAFRLTVVVLALLFALPAEASREWAEAPGPARTLTKEGRQGRGAKRKRRRVRRKRARATRFQKQTPFQHLGPGVSR